jgi:hypothetical protein
MDENKMVGCLGAMVALAVFMVIVVVFQGYVIQKLWDWFIVPTFMIPAISRRVAIGISIFFSLVTANPNAATKDYESDGTVGVLLEGFARDFTPTFFALVLGYIVYSV